MALVPGFLGPTLPPSALQPGVSNPALLPINVGLSIFDTLTGESADRRQKELLNNQLQLQEKRFEREDTLAAASEDKALTREERLAAFDLADRREERLARAEERRFERELQERRYQQEREERMALIAAGREREAETRAQRALELQQLEMKEQQKINANITMAAYAAQRDRIQFANRPAPQSSFKIRDRSEFSAPLTVEQLQAKPLVQQNTLSSGLLQSAGPILELGTTLAGLYIGKRFLGGAAKGLSSGLRETAEASEGLILERALTNYERAQKAVKRQTDFNSAASPIQERQIQNVRTKRGVDEGLSFRAQHRTLVL